MAHVSPLDVEDDIVVKEVHTSPECTMDRTCKKLNGKRVFILVRYCVCGKYVNTYELGIDFERDDLDMDGVFINVHRDGFYRYEEFRRGQKKYIFEIRYANEYEQHSHH
jgi:hypothetical protein